MKKAAFIYTITLGIVWEIAYALLITAVGLVIAFVVKITP